MRHWVKGMYSEKGFIAGGGMEPLEERTSLKGVSGQIACKAYHYHRGEGGQDF